MKKNQKKISISLLLILIISNGFGQFQFTPFTTLNFGRTDPTIQGIGIGLFPFGMPTNSRFHINNFLCNQPNGALNGLLFRADGNSAVDNNWQLHTGTAVNNVTEKFRISVLAPIAPLNMPNDVSLSTVQDGRMLFSTNGFNRMFIDNGLGLGNPGLGGGRIAIGNNLPAGFVPQSRVHMHQAGGNPSPGNNTYIRFTNNVTGVLATDGFAMDVDEKNNAVLTNFESNILINAPTGQIIFKDSSVSISVSELYALKEEVQDLKNELLQLRSMLAQK